MTTPPSDPNSSIVEWPSGSHSRFLMHTNVSVTDPKPQSQPSSTLLPSESIAATLPVPPTVSKPPVTPGGATHGTSAVDSEAKCSGIRPINRTMRPMPWMAFLHRGKDDAAPMSDPSPAAVRTGPDTSPSGALAASADHDANTMKNTARQNAAVLLGRKLLQMSKGSNVRLRKRTVEMKSELLFDLSLARPVTVMYSGVRDAYTNALDYKRTIARNTDYACLTQSPETCTDVRQSQPQMGSLPLSIIIRPMQHAFARC
ncbi:hypothetical protein EI94DRAFT_1706232 [Lactarius quietus]|nr:hypothetical protein EI94DRAFT_1706232 [Lactarius quietus]